MSVKSVKAIINGQTYKLNLNSETGKYEATITAPMKSSYPNPGHYYPVEVMAEDNAGNTVEVDDTSETLGTSLRLQVKEKVAPVIVITAPTSGQLMSNNKPEITFTVTDNDSGIDSDSIKLRIDNSEVSGVEKQSTEDGYTCRYTPSNALDDGDHSISVSASDNDGNVATPVSITFEVMATAPNLSVTTPANASWYKTPAVAFSGTTNGVTLMVQVGDGSLQNVEISGGTFSGTLNLDAEGANMVTFQSISESGVTTTVTRTLYLDTHAPVIQSVTITPNPVDAGKTYVLAVEVTD